MQTSVGKLVLSVGKEPGQGFLAKNLGKKIAEFSEPFPADFIRE